MFSIHTLNSCWHWCELHACAEGTKYLYLKYKSISLLSSFPESGTPFRLNYIIPSFLCPNSFPRKPSLWHSSAWHLIIHYPYFWEERAEENVRDYYDDRITWDFTTILDANITNLFTNILKIDQVFRFGNQHNPKWQSTTFKVYWWLDKSGCCCLAYGRK